MSTDSLRMPCTRYVSHIPCFPPFSRSRIAFWDVDVQPHPVAVIQDETRARINCMALAPGGRYLATAHDDTTVKIFGALSLDLWFVD
jgi:hypothetical protein